jgi:hypothetical protein
MRMRNTAYRIVLIIVSSFQPLARPPPRKRSSRSGARRGKRSDQRQPTTATGSTTQPIADVGEPHHVGHSDERTGGDKNVSLLSWLPASNLAGSPVLSAARLLPAVLSCTSEVERKEEITGNEPEEVRRMEKVDLQA